MERLSVLVVDDEPGIRSGVRRILSGHTVSFPFMEDDYGFDCREAATGEEALEMIDADPPDILLLDNKLPGISGIEVLEIIQQGNPEILVAMITSYASMEVAARATDDAARDFIPKPFTPAELKASVDLITKQLFLKRITRTMKEEVKKIRYQFLSVLSHELKSPLNALEGYLEMMKARELGESLGAYKQVLDRSLQRIDGMRSLILDLLDFTKIRLERKEDKIEKLELEERALLAISTIKPLAIQRNISISFKGESDLFIEADPTDLDIMLNNLLSNAVKYNRDGGSVEVQVIKQGGKIEIAVRDTGFGMNEKEVSQLFKEHIKVESEPEKGSEFRVILPVQ